MPQTNDPDRAAKLLLKALDSLPERDRDLVLRSLLTGGIGPIATGPPPPHHRGGSPSSRSASRFGMEMVRQVDQPLLVRLPADLHGRFRRWATDHGFSMAAVVRGLVERFLESQEGEGSAGKPRGSGA